MPNKKPRYNEYSNDSSDSNDSNDSSDSSDSNDSNDSLIYSSSSDEIVEEIIQTPLYSYLNKNHPLLKNNNEDNYEDNYDLSGCCFEYFTYPDFTKKENKKVKQKIIDPTTISEAIVSFQEAMNDIEKEKIDEMEKFKNSKFRKRAFSLDVFYDDKIE